MTFDEWWKQRVIKWKINERASFFPSKRMVARAAWDAGMRHGCMKTLGALRDHKSHKDKEG